MPISRRWRSVCRWDWRWSLSPGRANFDGLIGLFRPIPPLAWVPLSILWLASALSVVFITFLAAFFAVLINTIAGARAVDPSTCALHSRSRRRRRMMTHVVMPSVAPYIFTAFRIALGVSWMSIVAAELVAASSGLGYMIMFTRGAAPTRSSSAC
jgi:ABC-type nitrate/sulfonate/bicarbonate transport system permease component